MVIDVDVKVSLEDIDRQLKCAKLFIEKYPTDVWGGDNKRSYQLFVQIIDRVKEGDLLNDIEDDTFEMLSDGEYCEVINILNWLRGDEVEPYYEP